MVSSLVFAGSFIAILGLSVIKKTKSDEIGLLSLFAILVGLLYLWAGLNTQFMTMFRSFQNLVGIITVFIGFRIAFKTGSAEVFGYGLLIAFIGILILLKNVKVLEGMIQWKFHIFS